MPNQIQKSLQDYISKMKKTNPQNLLPSTPRSLSSSTSWILRGCRHPRTPSFASDDQGYEKQTIRDMATSHAGAGAGAGAGAATLSDIDRFLFENFNSLYKKEEEEEEEEEEGEELEKRSLEEKPAHEILLDSPRTRRSTHPQPPEINVCGSRRFVVTEEARTSLTTNMSEDVSSSSTTTTTSSACCTINDSTRRRTSGSDDDDHHDAKKVISPDDFITLLTYSHSPYDDFKNSMQEMIDARFHHNGKINWEFMEELLFCYLNLNDKRSYRFILGAFVDLVLVLRENSGGVPATANPRTTGSSKAKGAGQQEA